MIHAAEQERADVAFSRNTWRLFQAFIDPDRLVFLDETCLKTDMTTRYGRAPRSERCVDHTPGRCWSTTTLLTAIRCEGVIEEASLVCPGAMNSDLFESYAESFLSRALKPGDIVVMDNLSCHKRAEVAAAIEAVGASLWYLPPYSPDLNPIEQAFSKIKQALRRAAARSWDELIEAAVDAMRSITPGDIRGYMVEAGYRVDD